MSDGMNDARRQAEAIRELEKALPKLIEALEAFYDPMFGLHPYAVEEMCQGIQRFGVRVVGLVPFKGI